MPTALERPEITSFLGTWENKPTEQVAEELASYSLETKRIPDPYHFLISQSGELLSPTAYCRIRDVVQRTLPAGEFEYQALSAIEQWAKENNEGVIAWVSPPYPGIYPTSKIIISEIQLEGQTKKLFNRALILDFDEEKCLRFAQDLSNHSQNRPLLSHLDEVRSTPLILNTKGSSWTYILQELIVDPDLWRNVRRGVDIRAKEEALIQARIIHHSLFDKSMPIEDARRMVMGMLGDKSVSCPWLAKARAGTAFQVFAGSSLSLGGSSSLESDQYGSLEFDCPKCKRTNRRPKGQLIPNCQHCRTDVSC